MPGNFDEIIRQILGMNTQNVKDTAPSPLKPSASEYDTLNMKNVDDETFNKLIRGKTTPLLRDQT